MVNVSNALAGGVALVIEEKLREAAETAVAAAVLTADIEQAVKDAIDEERIDRQAEKAVEEAAEGLDFDDAIADAVEKYDFDEAITEAVKDSGLDNLIETAVREKAEELLGDRDFLVSLANLVAGRLALRNVRRPLLSRLWRRVRVTARLLRRRGR